MKQVGTFKYFTITPDARCDAGLKKRIAFAFAQIKSIFTNRIIRIYTKINILKAYIIIAHPSACM